MGALSVHSESPEITNLCGRDQPLTSSKGRAMSRFETSEPIAVSIDLAAGNIRVAASDRTDTLVEVRPSDPAKKSDVRAAEQTRVEYADGRLTIKSPNGGWRNAFRATSESVDVQIDLPSGSRLRGGAGAAALLCTGRLGECSYKIGAGNVEIEHAGPVDLKTGAGSIAVERAVDRVTITTAHGRVEVASIDAPAVIKNSNGDIWIGVITGDLRVSGANGRIVVDQAQAGVVAKTARGDVLLGEVARGSVQAETAFGRVDIGILDGVAAWLDLNTSFGKVHNTLDAGGQPAAGEDTVEVRARTAFGDINIGRSHAQHAATGRD
jgi:hypothetical protein